MPHSSGTDWQLITRRVLGMTPFSGHGLDFVLGRDSGAPLLEQSAAFNGQARYHGLRSTGGAASVRRE